MNTIKITVGVSLFANILNSHTVILAKHGLSVAENIDIFDTPSKVNWQFTHECVDSAAINTWLNKWCINVLADEYAWFIHDIVKVLYKTIDYDATYMISHIRIKSPKTGYMLDASIGNK